MGAQILLTRGEPVPSLESRRPYLQTGQPRYQKGGPGGYTLHTGGGLEFHPRGAKQTLREVGWGPAVFTAGLNQSPARRGSSPIFKQGSLILFIPGEAPSPISALGGAALTPLRWKSQPHLHPCPITTPGEAPSPIATMQEVPATSLPRGAPCPNTTPGEGTQPYRHTGGRHPPHLERGETEGDPHHGEHTSLSSQVGNFATN